MGTVFTIYHFVVKEIECPFKQFIVEHEGLLDLEEADTYLAMQYPLFNFLYVVSVGLCETVQKQ